MLKQFWEVKHLWGMPPKNSGGSTKFPGGHKVIHRTAQTAFVRVVTPRGISELIKFINQESQYEKRISWYHQQTRIAEKRF